MKNLHLICNAHIDPVWQWTWDEGFSSALATFKSACDLADEFDYVFCHNESLLYEETEKKCPELFERIKKLVKQGKWKIMGGWYIQPDCLMPSGESFVRQIKVGHKYFKEKFGIVPEIATNFDSFGHSLGLVQILAKNGYKGYVITRPNKWEMNYPDGKFFKWTAPSGHSVTLTKERSYCTLLGVAAENITEKAKTAEDVDYVLWGVGNHGGGPSRKDLRDIANLDIDGVNIIHSCLENLFKDDIKISAEIKHSLVTSMQGCYVSMAKIKKAHREAENILYSTEKMLAVASLSGYKPDLTALYEAQKKLLLAEFHDILPGSCIPDGESDGLDLLATCKTIAKDYRTGAFTYLTSGEPVAKDGEYPVYVFNPTPYEITAPIEVEFMLASQNWENYVLEPEVYKGEEKVPSQLIKEESTMNLDWRKKVIFSGKLKPLGVTRFSIYTKQVPFYDKYSIPSVAIDEKEFLKDTVLQSPLIIESYDDSADPWLLFDGFKKPCEQPGLGENPVAFRYMTETEIKDFLVSDQTISPVHRIEDGEVMTAVESFITNGKSNAVIEYRKYKDQKYLDVKVTVEFAEKNKILKLKLPVPNGITIGDGPYIVEEKTAYTEQPYQKWFGVKQKDDKVFAVINDGVYSGTIKDGFMNVNLLRGSGHCFHPIPVNDDGTGGDRRLYPVDRYMPRIDNGRYVFKFRILEGSVNDVTCESLFFNEKPYAVNVFPLGTGSKTVNVSTDQPVLMPTFKIGENGGYVLRFFNPEPVDKTFTLTVNSNKTVLTIKKYQVVSVVYDDGNFDLCEETMPV